MTQIILTLTDVSNHQKYQHNQLPFPIAFQKSAFLATQDRQVCSGGTQTEWDNKRPWQCQVCQR